MYRIMLPLVNWGMGTVIIGVFAVVCVVISLVVYNLATSDNKKKDSEDSV